MSEKGIQTNEAETNLAQFEKEGKTAMLISVDNELRGVVAVAIQLKILPNKLFKNFMN